MARADHFRVEFEVGLEEICDTFDRAVKLGFETVLVDYNLLLDHSLIVSKLLYSSRDGDDKT